jgi:hypothetical protein
MNSINKIGVMALTKIFKTKPYDSNGTTYISEVIFSKQEINFDTLLMNDSKLYKIWSIELGVIYVDHKANQSSVYCAILKTLKKLQKNNVPSHIIISEMVREDKKITNTYRIHRLTEDQELTMYYQDLMPSINKRDEGLRAKAEREYKEYLAFFN